MRGEEEGEGRSERGGGVRGEEGEGRRRGRGRGGVRGEEE